MDRPKVSVPLTNSCSDITQEISGSRDCTEKRKDHAFCSKLPNVSGSTVEKEAPNLITDSIAQMIDRIDQHSSTEIERQTSDPKCLKVPLAERSIDASSLKALQSHSQSGQTSCRQDLVTSQQSVSTTARSTLPNSVLRSQKSLSSRNGNSDSIPSQSMEVDVELIPTPNLSAASIEKVSPANGISPQSSSSSFAGKDNDPCYISDIEADLLMDNSSDSDPSEDTNPVTEESIRQRFTRNQDQRDQNAMAPTYPRVLPPLRPLCHVDTSNDPCLLIHRWPRIPMVTTSHKDSGPEQMKLIFDAFHEESAKDFMSDEVDIFQHPAKTGNNDRNLASAHLENEWKKRLALHSGVLIDAKHSARMLHGTEKPPLAPVGSGGYYGFYDGSVPGNRVSDGQSQRGVTHGSPEESNAAANFEPRGSVLASRNGKHPNEKQKGTSGEKRTREASGADPSSSVTQPLHQRRNLTAKRTLSKDSRPVEKIALCARSSCSGQSYQPAKLSLSPHARTPPKDILQDVKEIVLRSPEKTEKVSRTPVENVKKRNCPPAQTKRVLAIQSERRSGQTIAVHANTATPEQKHISGTQEALKRSSITSSETQEAQVRNLAPGPHVAGTPVLYDPIGFVPHPAQQQAQIGTRMTSSVLQANLLKSSAPEDKPLPTVPVVQFPRSPVVVEHAPIAQTLTAPIHMLPTQPSQIPPTYMMNFGQTGQVGQAATGQIALEQVISGHMMTCQTCNQLISPTYIASPHVTLTDEGVTPHAKESSEILHSTQVGAEKSFVARMLGQNEPSQSRNTPPGRTSSALAPKGNEKQTETRTKRRYTRRASPSSTAPRGGKRSYKQRRSYRANPKKSSPTTSAAAQAGGSKDVVNTSRAHLHINGVAIPPVGNHARNSVLSRSASNKRTKQQLNNLQPRPAAQSGGEMMPEVSAVHVRNGHFQGAATQGHSSQGALMQAVRNPQAGPARPGTSNCVQKSAQTQAGIGGRMEETSNPFSSKVQKDPSAQKKGKVHPVGSSESHQLRRTKRRTSLATRSLPAGAGPGTQKSLSSNDIPERKEEFEPFNSFRLPQIAPMTPANLEEFLFSSSKDHEVSQDQAGVPVVPDQVIDCPIFLENELPELSELFNMEIDDM